GTDKFHHPAGEDTLQFAFVSQVQNDVFGGARGAEFSRQANANGFRHSPGNLVVFPDAGNLRVSNPLRKTINRPGRTRVGIRTADDLAGQCNLLADNCVANAGAAAELCPMEDDSGLFGKALLTFAQVLDTGQSFARDSREVWRQGQMVW